MKTILATIVLLLSACSAPDGFVSINPEPIREIMPRTLGYAKAHIELLPPGLERDVRMGDIEIMELWLAQVLSVNVAEVRAIAPVLAPGGATEEEARELLRRQSRLMEAENQEAHDLILPPVPD